MDIRNIVVGDFMNYQRPQRAESKSHGRRSHDNEQVVPRDPVPCFGGKGDRFVAERAGVYVFALHTY